MMTSAEARQISIGLTQRALSPEGDRRAAYFFLGLLAGTAAAVLERREDAQAVEAWEAEGGAVAMAEVRAGRDPGTRAGHSGRFEDCDAPECRRAVVRWQEYRALAERLGLAPATPPGPTS